MKLIRSGSYQLGHGFDGLEDPDGFPPQTEHLANGAGPLMVAACVGTALFAFVVGAAMYVCYRRKNNFSLEEATAYKLQHALRKSSGDGGDGAKQHHHHHHGKSGKSSRFSGPGGLMFKKTPAVKSPTGGGSGPILKTSPSPTGSKSPPSIGTSPTSGGRTVLSGQQPLPPQTKPVVQQHRASTLAESPESKIEKEIMDDKPVKLGELHFKMRYLADKQALFVTIVKCAGLPSKDPSVGSSDPYVKLQLLPDKQHKVKTRVVRKTTNPVYDEDFTFYGVTANQALTGTLHFVILSFDRYSRDDVIGEVLCPVAELIDGDSINDRQVSFIKEIAPRHFKIKSQGRGELLVSLCHQPAANRLTVVVLKARNLPKVDDSGLCDPYVKMYLLYNGQRIAKKKTHVKKRTVNPVFNESFIFDVPYNEGLNHLSIELLMLDWDRVTKNEVIGRLELGAKVDSTAARQHWSDVCNSPRRQIAEWHKLKE